MSTPACSVFEYLYCDASNYKAWGTLLLSGTASKSDHRVLSEKFESGEFFIAEQLRIPTLYSGLIEFSNGPTADDHVWHTFSDLRMATPEDATKEVFGSLADFVARVQNVKEWRTELSPNWSLRADSRLTKLPSE